MCAVVLYTVFAIGVLRAAFFSSLAILDQHSDAASDDYCIAAAAADAPAAAGEYVAGSANEKIRSKRENVARVVHADLQ